MTETTTIEITAEQKAQLDDLKASDSEAYKSVIARLLDGYSDSQESAEADEIAYQVAKSMDYGYLSDKVADKVVERMP